MNVHEASSSRVRAARSRRRDSTRRPVEAGPASPPSRGPSDSSVARMRWEDDGGACVGGADAAGGSSSRRAPAAVPCYDLVVLPFAEYSAVYDDRVAQLRQRLTEIADGSPRPFVVLDATRVTRPGALLLGVLHSVAAQLRRRGARLVLVGDLRGLAAITRLDQLCEMAATRDAAFAWCNAQAGGL